MPELQSLRSPTDGSVIDDRLSGIDDVFLIPAWDRYVLYSPRTRLILALTEDEVPAATRIVHSHGDIGSILKYPAENDASTPWRPTSVTFSNTQKCTLRCKYCYADGGRLDDAVIATEVLDAAIDLIIQNASELGADPGINFLGEGEATADWVTFTHAIQKFKSRCVEAGLQPHVSLSTNGIFPQNRVEYIAGNVDHITFSLDGIGASHDQNRITPNGRGSFDLVVKTMKAFDNVKKEYGIRCTATVEAARELPGFISWIGQNLSCKDVHVEPVFDNSNMAKTAEHVDEPAAALFVKMFRRARQVSASYGIDLYFSSADLKFKTSFCGVTDASNMVVTSKGLLTSCNEVLRKDDKRASKFQYGSWNGESHQFDVNEDTVRFLSSVNVTNLRKCQDCFAKYNCAGDCYAKTDAQYGDIFAPNYTSRCDVTRELTRDNLLLEILKSANDTKSSTARSLSE